MADDKHDLVIVEPDTKLTARQGRGGGARFTARRPRGKRPALRRPGRKSLSQMSVKDAGSLALEAWNASKYILSMINVEHKYFDVLTQGALPDYNGTFYNLSNIAQGADVVNRDGDSILMTRMEFHLICYPGGTSTSNAVRFIIFRDMEQDGVDPAINTVLEAAGLGATSTIITPLTYFYAGPGTSRKRRFEVLHDEVIVCTRAGGSPTIGITKYVHDFKGGDHHILYDATAAADASNREGMVGLMLFSDGTGAGMVPTVSFYSRIIFTDD